MAPDLEHYTGFPQEPQLFLREQPVVPAEHISGGIRNRIDFMASHMFQQWKEHEEAQHYTSILFEQLLCQLEEAVVTFRHAFLQREVPIGGVYAKIDSDRSVGILHLLWHTISFTCRGNTKPMALKRRGKEPIFTGRIVATLGDYQDNIMLSHNQDQTDLLEDELASLYIPASPVQPVVMRLRHSKEEFYCHQAEATQQFLLKILEAVCGGGYFHETVTD